ncbi:MAG: VWA domain-containing protein [Ignavibacteria bacterium]|nr:VWA domain-containing protein [Ignavibacteria bacterium]
MFNYQFANPNYLYLLLLIPILAIWYWLRHHKQQTDVVYSNLKAFAFAPKTLRERLRHFPFLLRMVVLALVIIALARPQSSMSGERLHTEGIDIVLVLDISGSMLAEDFRPNRIEAAKNVASEFISARENDRIGLVIFSGESFTQCPLTLDHGVLKNLLLKVKNGMVTDGTAIGTALANAVNRLKDSDAKSKVLILLTDGVNNRGEIDPLTAADIAHTFDIRVYTIGVGTHGMAPYPVQTPFGTRYQNMPTDLDEKTLTKIAEMTGGKYFRATTNKELKKIYSDIDKMEKTKIETFAYRKHTDLFYTWLFFSIVVLFAEIGLSQTYLRKLP